ncbi:MAG: zinc ribbon domain-containing protein [Elusimicrobia bacterium]|nr:zinc ribbon domain-containing protein [Elusimicrobiota bacterium]
MADAAAQILCTKCGNASAEPRAECAKCGGKNARVCGACGNQNSVVKNFCDKCGRSITQLGPVAPPPKTVLPGSTTADIPQTVVKRNPPDAQKPSSAASVPGPKAPGSPPPPAKPAPAPMPIPAAGQFAPPPGSAQLDDLWSAPAPAPVAEETVSRPGRGTARKAFNALAALAGVAAAAFGVWKFYESRKPEVLVPKLAGEYLEALRTRDFPSAYAMFSNAAQKNCTQAEFIASRDSTTWTWSSLRIEYQEPGAVLLAYDLKAEGAPPRRDRVLFTLEDGRWARPYNWTLMRQVEDSFEKGDADKGLLLAQVAATINPRDPMAWGYLCEAAYYRKSPSDAEMRCLKSLSLAQTYPSNLTLKSLYHLHAILADTYHHALRRLDRALDQYAEMLAFPGISPADQCTILLARSSAYMEMSRPGEALADVERAAQLCENPQDQDYINRMRASLNAPAP